MRTPTSAIVLLVALLTALPVGAAETVRTVSWSELQDQGSQLPGQVVTMGDPPRECLKITNDQDEVLTRDLIHMDTPPVTMPRWALLGRMRDEDVRKKAILEMWSEVEGQACFSSTLAEKGPTAHFVGTSDWRPLVVPFFSKPGEPAPETIAMNVQMTGRGTVWLSDLRLMQFGAGENPLTAALSPDALWTEGQAGLLGGVLGTLAGLMGALVGLLAGFGRSRSFVIWILRGAVALGGVLALFFSQPWWVYYPMLQLGAILVIIPLAVKGGIQKRYEQAERQRMKAMDV